MTDPDARLDPAAPAHEPAPVAIDDAETFVVCVIDDQIYAIPVAYVRRVLPLPAITRIPTDAPHVVGVFHHMGHVVPLWDLHTLFASDASPPERPYVLVLEDEGRVFGVAVADVDEVVPLVDPLVQPFSKPPPAPVDQVVAGMLTVRETDAPDTIPDGNTEGGTPGSRQAPATPVLGSLSEPLRAALQGGLARGAPTIGPGWEAHLIDVHRLFALGTGRPVRASPGGE